MRQWFVLFAVAGFLVSCNESTDSVIGFSKPTLRGESSEESNESASRAVNIGDRAVSQVEVLQDSADVTESRKAMVTSFPVDRVLTDSQGRSITAAVVGKRGNEITIEKAGSEKRFLLSLEKLSEKDRIEIARLPDGGEMSVPGNSTVISSRRAAIWHSQLENAKSEAKQLGIPLLIVVMNDDREANEKYEKELVYSRDFKSWADRNVSLSLLKPSEGSRDSSFQIWQRLKSYGIPQSTHSSITMINPGAQTGTSFKIDKRTNIAAITDLLDESIREKTAWASIQPAPDPIREASPFRVNGGVQIIGGSA